MRHRQSQGQEHLIADGMSAMRWSFDRRLRLLGGGHRPAAVVHVVELGTGQLPFAVCTADVSKNLRLDGRVETSE